MAIFFYSSNSIFRWVISWSASSSALLNQHHPFFIFQYSHPLFSFLPFSILPPKLKLILYSNFLLLLNFSTILFSSFFLFSFSSVSLNLCICSFPFCLSLFPLASLPFSYCLLSIHISSSLHVSNHLISYILSSIYTYFTPFLLQTLSCTLLQVYFSTIYFSTYLYLFKFSFIYYNHSYFYSVQSAPPPFQHLCLISCLFMKCEKRYPSFTRKMFPKVWIPSPDNFLWKPDVRKPYFYCIFNLWLSSSHFQLSHKYVPVSTFKK